MTSQADRLKEARIAAGFATAADAARQLGMTYATYAGHENGSSGFKAKTAEIYARKFRVSFDWLLTGRGSMAASPAMPVEIEIAGLPILGNIQAGHWLETTFVDGEMDPEVLPVARDLRFPRARQYALRVIGDSMDLEYPDGSYVTCVDFADSGLSYAEGMTVHVERLRAGGQLVEITLKVLGRQGRDWMLIPRSSNPAWQPIAFRETDADVVVKGVVTGGWRKTNIPR